MTQYALKNIAYRTTKRHQKIKVFLPLPTNQRKVEVSKKRSKSLLIIVINVIIRNIKKITTINSKTPSLDSFDFFIHLLKINNIYIALKKDNNIEPGSNPNIEYIYAVLLKELPN
jgi:hypothetical protein